MAAIVVITITKPIGSMMAVESASVVISRDDGGVGNDIRLGVLLRNCLRSGLGGRLGMITAMMMLVVPLSIMTMQNAPDTARFLSWIIDWVFCDARFILISLVIWLGKRKWHRLRGWLWGGLRFRIWDWIRSWPRRRTWCRSWCRPLVVEATILLMTVMSIFTRATILLMTPPISPVEAELAILFTHRKCRKFNWDVHLLLYLNRLLGLILRPSMVSMATPVPSPMAMQNPIRTSFLGRYFGCNKSEKHQD